MNGGAQGLESAPELLTSLATDPAEVPRARRLVADRIAAWGADADTDTVLLLTSELVTNALLHGRPPLQLRICPHDRGVHVEVHDAAGARTPRRQERITLDDLTGRGLTLVEALSDRWGWEDTVQGKLVWFEVDG